MPELNVKYRIEIEEYDDEDIDFIVLQPKIKIKPNKKGHNPAKKSNLR